MAIQFRLEADADAQCLPRVLDQFAQRDMIPAVVQAHRAGDMLTIRIEHPTLDEAVALLVCERMRRIISVVSVSVSPID